MYTKTDILKLEAHLPQLKVECDRCFMVNINTLEALLKTIERRRCDELPDFVSELHEELLPLQQSVAAVAGAYEAFQYYDAQHCTYFAMENEDQCFMQDWNERFVVVEEVECGLKEWKGAETDSITREHLDDCLRCIVRIKQALNPLSNTDLTVASSCNTNSHGSIIVQIQVDNSTHITNNYISGSVGQFVGSIEHQTIKNYDRT